MLPKHIGGNVDVLVAVVLHYKIARGVRPPSWAWGSLGFGLSFGSHNHFVKITEL